MKKTIQHTVLPSKLLSAVVLVVALLATVSVPTVMARTEQYYYSSCSISASSDCRGDETLIFSDEFDYLDMQKWKHDITLGGGGNGEFQVYLNNRSLSYVTNGNLYLNPRTTQQYYGTSDITQPWFDINLWGSCTNNAFNGCQRQTRHADGNIYIVNPITSARVTTVDSFAFKYGRVEVKAKLPKGDWIWPAIWLLPKTEAYGGWPASGEIDIMESRGNVDYRNKTGGKAGGVETIGSTLHWGPDWASNAWFLTHSEYQLQNGKTFADDYHIFGLYWSDTKLYTYIDDPQNIVMKIDTSSESYWQRANNAGLGWDAKNLLNPWQFDSSADKSPQSLRSAPFNQEYYLILNVAVGGQNGYFQDVPGKPWKNGSPTAMTDFWTNRDMWQHTWKGDDVAMKIDSVRVWSIPNLTTFKTNK